MKIGLISDTHVPDTGPEPPSQITQVFHSMDLILHAGDIRTPKCLDWLEQFAPVLAVEVPPSPSMEDARVLEKRVVHLSGHAVGLIHDLQIEGAGWEVIPGIISRKFPPEQSLPRALENFFGEPVDTVVFGHTHIPMIETHQGILLVNPGSPSLPRQIRRLGTVGVLEFSGGTREASIIDLSSIAIPT